MILSHSNKKLGLAAETMALRYLIQQGLKPISRNYRCNFGEIDLIMKDEADLVFIEVRYRKQAYYGSAEESVDYIKQQKLIKTALHYLQKHPLYHTQSCRFDVVAISKHENSYKVKWLKNAFQVS